MKKGDKIAVVATTLIFGAMLFPVAEEWMWSMKRHWVGSKIKACYMRGASQGEVAFPATNSDAIQCWSTCFYSLPDFVKVKDPSGNTFSYFAEPATNSAAPYNFRYITGMDAKGNFITNAPGMGRTKI